MLILILISMGTNLLFFFVALMSLRKLKNFLVKKTSGILKTRSSQSFAIVTINGLITGFWKVSRDILTDRAATTLIRVALKATS